MWGPARVHGQDQERYFLLVVEDYMRSTTVFPLRSKADVRGVLIDWIIAICRQLSARFEQDLQVLRLHSDRGGEFSSVVLQDFCRAKGIHQTFTLPASLQQNGIVERRIGLVMDVARTFMIHAATPHLCGHLRSDTPRISSTSGPMSLCQRPRRHCAGRERLAMRWRFGSGARSPLFAIPPQASSLLALSAASSLASPPTPRPSGFTTLSRAGSCLHRTSPLTIRTASTISTRTHLPRSPRRPSS
ncbi:unnamed protein product [Closterium sp. NIES-53]